jgi:hypothetical protein
MTPGRPHGDFGAGRGFADTGFATPQRRECVLLSFTPFRRGLPVDIRGHLIQHLALPTEGERRPTGAWAAELLPSFTGRRRDLPLNRVAPGRFPVSG